MITVSEAKNIIKDHVSVLDPIRMLLADAAGKVLAKDVFAPDDVPGFAQSAMDGYAFAYDSSSKNQPLNIVGELQAGADKELHIKNGEAARIFTGAPLPEGADTVVMQEKTSVNQFELLIEDEKLLKGSNVRLVGSEIKKEH
ncbi:MoeA family protein [Niabella ginsengisoli]|uniref:Molybdopterin molybdenumtransferase n=1 Tax=Niabella ginsengisoli TaxID=522298 RepID=A0ABS9SJI9_9BACT|nr:hypothetical protein [Niabella ginsengisoli]MCH5598557.1 hypothetical protein [Niabella ginsengisoli]